MVAVINTVGVGQVIYNAGTALVRYLYVRSSFVVNIQEVLRRDSFIFKSMFIGECVNLFNLGSFYFKRETSEFGRSPLVLYQACMNPGRDHTFQVYKLKPWNQLIMISAFMVNASCNLFLSRFLRGNTETNSARSEADKKKDRKRNLIPAHIGIGVLATYAFTLGFFIFTYSYKSDNFDSATRAFLNAAFTDLFHCIITPVVIIYWSMDTRRKIRSIFSNMVAKITNQMDK